MDDKSHPSLFPNHKAGYYNLNSMLLLILIPCITYQIRKNEIGWNIPGNGLFYYRYQFLNQFPIIDCVLRCFVGCCGVISKNYWVRGNQQVPSIQVFSIVTVNLRGNNQVSLPIVQPSNDNSNKIHKWHRKIVIFPYKIHISDTSMQQYPWDIHVFYMQPYSWPRNSFYFGLTWVFVSFTLSPIQ